jgi:hypothetical protein
MKNNLFIHFLLGISVAISLTVAILESFTYFGYFFKHFSLPVLALYASSIFIVILLRKIIPTSQVLTSTIKITTLAAITSLIILSIVEALTFPNFIFAHTHLNLLSYPYLVFLLLSYYSISLYKSKTMLEILSRILLLLGISLYLFLNVPKVITGIYKGFREIIASPTASYDDKMKLAYGDFYSAMRHVQDLTPNDAIIAIPPQENPWLTEGNGALVRYFVYPRQLTHIETKTYDVAPTHYLIAKGSWNVADKSKYGWPKEKIKANRIWEFKNDGTVVEYSHDYDPSTDKWDWGLIEVAK